MNEQSFVEILSNKTDEQIRWSIKFWMHCHKKIFCKRNKDFRLKLLELRHHLKLHGFTEYVQLMEGM